MMTPTKFLSNPGPAELPPTADVVIIGGGPAGTAILWALDRLAPGIRTILIERADRLGAGSSLASLENFRTCWPADCLARLMQRSLEVLLQADEYLGEGAAQSLALKQRGYLFCALTEAEAHTFQADVGRLQAIGLSEAEYLNAAAVQDRFGWVGERVIAAKYDPTAGWLDSNALIYRYAQAASQAQILLSVPDVQIVVAGDRVTGVRVPGGMISAPKVVIAAGANSRAVGRTAGIELPIIVRPRQSFTTGWRHPQYPEDGPMIIGAAPHPHMRPEAGTGAIFGWEYHWQRKHVDPQYGTNAARDALIDPVYPADSLKDPRLPSITLALLARQFGHLPGQGFADPRYLRGISHHIGYYVYRDETTAYRVDADGVRQPYASERAIIDAVPDLDGLYVSVAHVGHGIMSSPATGEMMAHKILGRPLPDPAFEAFGFHIPWVEYDENTL